MAMTPSNMLPLGTRAPTFKLPDTVSGKELALESLKGEKGTVVMFICNHCPYVKHVRGELAALARDYAPRGVAVVAIMPNDVAQYPEDGPEAMRREKEEAGYDFPYLYDETQEVAKAYRAACTPDFFLFGPELRLVYRGQLDDSRPTNGVPVTGRELRAALDAVLDGRPVPPEQTPGIGCGIKWMPGHEPEYQA